MPTLKLSYFNIQGPAEPARLALTIGGVAFEDERVDFAAWKEGRKATTKYGQLPILNVDGTDVYQSAAITSYCAKIAGIAPSDPLKAAQVDEIVQFVNQDIKDRQIAKSMESSLSPEDKAAKRKDLNDNILPEKLAFLESMISKSGYFFEDITIADLTVYGLCNWIGMGVLDGISGDCITSLPKLKNLVSKLNEHEKVKAYNAEKNPKLPWF